MYWIFNPRIDDQSLGSPQELFPPFEPGKVFKKSQVIRTHQLISKETQAELFQGGVLQIQFTNLYKVSKSAQKPDIRGVK